MLCCAVLCCAVLLLAPGLISCTVHQITDRYGWVQAENQAIDRVHRIGQEHDVTVHRLYMAGSCYAFHNHNILD